MRLRTNLVIMAMAWLVGCSQPPAPPAGTFAATDVQAVRNAEPPRVRKEAAPRREPSMAELAGTGMQHLPPCSALPASAPECVPRAGSMPAQVDPSTLDMARASREGARVQPCSALAGQEQDQCMDAARRARTFN